LLLLCLIYIEQERVFFIMATEAATATMTTNDWTYETYIQYLDQLGESILQWADPEHQFRGHTNVRIHIEI
jgi:hypothetical protein